MLDYRALLYDPIYEQFGVDAQIDLWDGTFTVLDKTAGVAVNLGDINVQSMLPAAVMQAHVLSDNNMEAADLKGATLTLKPEGLPETNWTIKSHQMKPSPNGEADGEVYLFLESDA